MKTFADNLERIEKHNKEAAAGKHSFTLGVNKFTDLTNAEWREFLQCGLNITKEGKPTSQRKKKFAKIPDHVDWRDQVSYIYKNILFQ